MEEIEEGVGVTQKWTKFISAWASVNYGTGEERRGADQEQASLRATFQILSSVKSRQITPKHRLIIKTGGTIWDIISAVPSGYNEGVDITAKRNAENAQSENN